MTEENLVPLQGDINNVSNVAVVVTDTNMSTSKDINVSLERPVMINKLENIPQYLRPLKQWLLWEYKLEKDSWTKKPLTQWSNSENLMTYDNVIIARNNNKDIGIGFVFSDDNDIIGIDIDKCFTTNKSITPSIDRLMTLVNGYTEVTPSTYGLHIIGRVKDKSLYQSNVDIKYDGCDHIEFYTSKRFFTFTGLYNKELPLDIDFINEEILLTSFGKKDNNKLSERFELNIDIVDGGRNKHLYKAACSMRSKGFGKTEITGALKETNRLRCVPPLSHEELELLISSAMRYEPSNPIITKKEEVKEIEEVIEIKVKNDDVIFNMKDLPENHLIRKYVEYGEDIQDAYPEYHMVNIMTLLSDLVVAKNIPVFGDVYNNLWFIVMGRAGESGKSTAMSLTNKLISDISKIYPLYKMSDKPTPESFIQLLSENNKRIMMVDEVSGLFKYFKRDYAKEMVEYILQTYSHYGISRSTLAKKNGEGGVIACENPHISMLWYTTPDAYTKNVDQEWYVNGFCQRPMYIMAMRNKSIMKDRYETAEDKMNYNNILNHCLELCKYSQEKYIVFEENKILNEWKYEKRLNLSKVSTDIKRSAITRSFEHSRKIAMILTLGSDEFISWLATKQGNETKIEGWTQPTLIFNIPDWAAKLAIKWCENFIENFNRVHKLTVTDCGGSIIKLQRSMDETEDGWLGRSACQDIVRKYGKQFDELINDLITEGMVDQKLVKTRGRQSIMYKWIGN